eukprot:gene19474-23153_t
MTCPACACNMTSKKRQHITAYSMSCRFGADAEGESYTRTKTMLEHEKEQAILEKIHADISRIYAEQRKLNAESHKITRENFWYPVGIAIGFFTAVGTVMAARIPELPREPVLNETSDKPLRIVLADDHPIFLIGLRAVLERDERLTIVGEANSPLALGELLQRCACDILVTDFMMPAEPQADGLRLIEQLRRHHPGLPIVVVTMLNNAGLFHAILELGVMGLLSKASLADELPEAIRQVRQQRRYVAQTISQSLNLAGVERVHSQDQLSPRELEVIRLLAGGLTVGEIAANLHRSKQTVS